MTKLELKQMKYLQMKLGYVKQHLSQLHTGNLTHHRNWMLHHVDEMRKVINEYLESTK